MILSIGHKYNKWTIIDTSERKNNRKAWLCQCECGTIRSVEERRLKNGMSKSCGCLAIKNMRKAVKKSYDTNEDEYQLWLRNGNNRCSEWQDYEVFKAWIQDKEYDKNKHSFVIIDKNKALSPENCNIINKSEKAKGKHNRKSKMICYNGEYYNISELSKIHNISISTLSARLKNSPIEIALLPYDEYRKYNLQKKHENNRKDTYIQYTPFITLDCVNENNKHGVYMIKNTINDKFYIGSSIHIGVRWKEHIKKLESNSHHSPYLQNAWNKYGGGCFEFSIVEYCDKDKTIEREQYYLDTLNPHYNMSKKAHAPVGVIVSEETRRKMSNSSKWKRKIKQFDMDGNFIKEWGSIIEATKSLGLKSSSGIIAVCKNKMKSSGGYIWKYA